MSVLDDKVLENCIGGKLTSQEIEDFFGAASCVSIFFTGGLGLLFATGSCIHWLVK